MSQTSQAQNVVVIGHLNPDTDSVCAAIGYAELKNQLNDGLTYEPRRAGALNRETEFVLKRFGVKAPRLCTDVLPKVRNVNYRQIDGIAPDTSMRSAWEKMRDASIDTLCVVSEDRSLLGLITMQEIGIANMDVFDNTVLAKSGTSYRNILETLSGTMVVGSPEGAIDPRAHVRIGTDSPDVLESMLQPGDVVILGNRYESQICAIAMGVSLLIVCGDAPLTKTIQTIAEDKHVDIMRVPYDTYAAGKLISQCAPVSYYMLSKDLMKFSLFTTVETAISVMAKVRHRYFPILDENGKYCGMLSRRNVMKLEKRQMILVDHNEKTQAVEGFEQSNILEIIDHHRIGNLETTGPVFFRNQPLGSTSSIVALMYKEAGIMVSPSIAGLLLSAILSDTLDFSSPTCTPLDKVIAEDLAVIANVDIESYVEEMFTAAEDLHGRSGMDILRQDFKLFTCGDKRFGISQANFLTSANLTEAEKLVRDSMNDLRLEMKLEDIYVMLTNIRDSESTILYNGANAGKILYDTFDGDEDSHLILKGVVSRKKQFLPRIMETYQNL